MMTAVRILTFVIAKRMAAALATRQRSVDVAGMPLPDRKQLIMDPDDA